MLLGDPRQSDQRTQSFHLYFPIVVHQSLDPAAQSSAAASAKLLVLGRSPTSSNAAALIFRVSVLIFEAKSHLHFVLAFTQQR